MDLEELDGSLLALLLISEDEDGEDEGAVFSGIFRFREGVAVLDRGPDHPDIELLPEWLDRMKPTKKQTRPILLDAAYYIPLSVGNVADDDDLEAYRLLGLKWPRR